MIEVFKEKWKKSHLKILNKFQVKEPEQNYCVAQAQKQRCFYYGLVARSCKVLSKQQIDM